MEIIPIGYFTGDAFGKCFTINICARRWRYKIPPLLRWEINTTSYHPVLASSFRAIGFCH
jgi:hypothetical protein